LIEQFDYKPATPVEQGVTNFVAWYRDYFNKGSIGRRG
jgi:UDP-glucuronate 4-epimerase